MPVMQMTQEELDLCATDNLFFGRTFFPKTFRQASPEFHADICHAMDLRGNKVFKVFRDGAKTTLTRVTCARRLSFGISRIIMVVGKGQDHAIKTVQWLRNNITTNKLWADSFGLAAARDPVSGRPKKWTDEHICVYNKILDIEMHVIGVGITGQIRGVNLDDYRPDYIICDDILDDDNCATHEGREKIKDRFYGALANSLTPREENPDAAIQMLQTPIDADDLCEELCQSPIWESREYSCFNKDGKSVWEDRHSTERLQERKQEAIRVNKLSIWMREMEVSITSDELKLMRSEWLTDNFYEELPLKKKPIIVMSCDPTPPPKDKDQRDVQKLDDAVIQIWAYVGGEFYLMDYYNTKSPQSLELISKLFEFYLLYRPTFVGIETVLFARVLKDWLEREMQIRGIYFTVTPVEDRRPKFVRIKDTLQSLGAHGKIHVKPYHTEFIQEWNDYPQVKHDDHLDCGSIAIMQINPALLAAGNIIEGDFYEIDEDAPQLGFGGAP